MSCETKLPPWLEDRRISSQAGNLFHPVQLQSACPHPSWSSSGLPHLQLHWQMGWITSDQMKPSLANNQVLQLILSLMVEIAIFGHITPSFWGLTPGWELPQVLLPRALLPWGGLGLKKEPTLLSAPLNVPYAGVFRPLQSWFEGNNALHLHKT